MEEIIKAEFTRVDDENKRQNKRIDDLERKVEKFTDIALSIQKLSINMESMLTEQKTMRADLETIKSKAGKRWEDFVWWGFLAVAGVAVGLMFKEMGL